jgi:hypothetical protein
VNVWEPDDDPRRMPWGTILAGAIVAGAATAAVLWSQSAPAREPITLIALICGYDEDADRYIKDCTPFEDRATDVADCRAMAAWLRGASPAKVRVVHHECFRARDRQQARK